MSFSPLCTRMEQRPNTLEALAAAAEQAGRMPTDLQLRGVDIYDFCMEPTAVDTTSRFFRHLDDLSIWLEDLAYWREESDEDEEGESRIQDLMRAASGSVKTLDLQFPDRSPHAYNQAWRPLTQLLAPTDWPQLPKLSIALASVDKTLVDFLLQRVPSLKQVALTQLHLTESSWHMIFLLLGGQMKGLESATVQGGFSNEEPEEAEIGFSDAGREGCKAEMEKFIVEGGILPDLSVASRYLPAKLMTGHDYDSDYSEVSTDSEPGSSEDFEDDCKGDDLENLDDLGPTTETYLTWQARLASDGQQ